MKHQNGLGQAVICSILVYMRNCVRKKRRKKTFELNIYNTFLINKNEINKMATSLFFQQTVFLVGFFLLVELKA